MRTFNKTYIFSSVEKSTINLLSVVHSLLSNLIWEKGRLFSTCCKEPVNLMKRRLQFIWILAVLGLTFISSLSELNDFSKLRSVKVASTTGELLMVQNLTTKPISKDLNFCLKFVNWQSVFTQSYSFKYSRLSKLSVVFWTVKRQTSESSLYIEAAFTFCTCVLSRNTFINICKR